MVKVLTEMRDRNVATNGDTLVSCLTSLFVLSGKGAGQYGGGQAGQYGACCLLSLALLAEFRVAGVEPSLGAYKLLLDIFVPKGKKSNILQDILR